VVRRSNAYQHIGNLRAYVFADTLRRALEWKGYDVTHIINITDVGHLTSDMDVGVDKVELASRREHRSVWDIAAHYTNAFMHDVRELRVRTPSTWAKATEHIEQMIAFARALEDKGYAYRLETGLYFDTGRVVDYGKLARLDLEGLRGGSAGRADARKAPSHGLRALATLAEALATRDGVGRALGKGCSRLAPRMLDNEHRVPRRAVRRAHRRRRPHPRPPHERDRTRRGLPGGPWVPFWLHNEFVNLERAKIAKSTGNTLRLSDLEQRGYHPLSYRYLLLTCHYRSQIDFTWEGLEAARVGHRRLLERIRERLPGGGHPHGVSAAQLGRRGDEYLARIDAAISNDLNTPQALAVVTELSRDTTMSTEEFAILVATAEDLLAVGLLDLEPDDVELRRAPVFLAADDVEQLLERRAEARHRGDFATADRIRDTLERSGIELRDTREGTVWKMGRTK
jgi:cysteinyl-tRNA synthetase